MRKTVFLTVIFFFPILLSGQISIRNAEELRAVANNLSGSYVLQSNITLTGAWTPIGTQEAPFTGVFDGNGYVISGLTVNQPNIDSQGLFGYTSDAQIRNVGIADATISGRNEVGAIVGTLRGGSIRQCHVTSSSIAGSTNTGALAGNMYASALIENCYASSSVAVSTNSEAGGIAGAMSSGKVSKCYFAGSVSANEARANGIVGVVVSTETTATKTVEYSVNLSPLLLVKSDRAYPYKGENGSVEQCRIVNKNGQTATLNQNYSLLATRLGVDNASAVSLNEMTATIMSFNTPYFSDSESNEIKRWNYRKDAIIAAIKDKNPAFLGMQEIRKNPQLNDLDAGLSADYARIGVGRDDGADGGDFSVIYYKKDLFDLIATGDFWMSETPDVPSYGWGAAHRRITTWGHFKIKGTDKELLVYNTHLAHDSQQAKEESIKMMRDSMAGRLNDNVKTIIATGDYNEATTNVIFKPFLDFVWSTRDEAPTTDTHGTTNDWTVGGSTGIIDHVFYRNCIPKTFQVITATYNGIQLMSDHYPVTAGLGIPLDTEYGADGGQGESVVNSATLKTKQFYAYKLNWDFVDVWTINEGAGYPELKIFDKTASAVYEISDAAGLKTIANDLKGNYTLTADITLTGEWTPIGTEAAPFTGTLNGNGKIIRGLKCSNSATKKVGLFSVTKDAAIRNLGIENATMNGDADVAAIVGYMSGGLIEGCYVANSYIEGRDHVASLVGKLYGGGVVQNCYSSANINSRSTQAGGLCGVILDTGSKVLTSYFSGKAATPTGSSRPGGIVSLIDNNGRVSVERCVNLATSLLGSNVVRIVHWYNFAVTANLTDNYSLSATVVNVNGGVVSTADTNYGATKMHGQNLPDDDDALSSDFYVSTLNWDFDNGTWKFLPSGGYPILGWQNAPIGVTLFDKKDGGVMTHSSVFDLNSLITINNAKNTLAFTTTTSGVNISDNNRLTIDPSASGIESIVVTASLKQGFNLLTETPLSFTIQVFPDWIVIENVSDLQKIEQYPNVNFKLSNNLDMSGVSFAGLCSEAIPFTGTFDGDGHVISNLSFEVSGSRGAGFFRVTKGATVKNLGLENASIKLTSNHKSAGGIIGLMRGGVLEQCYVANSYVEGYDHAGSVVGSIEGLNEKADEGAHVLNCYGFENEVYSRSYQASGFSGTVMKGTVENCYFSGVVRSGNRAVGLFGYVDNTGHQASDVVVKNCINLASELQSTGFEQAKLFRIIDNNAASDRPMTLINNHSLPSTKLTGKEGTTATATLEITSTGRNGANLSKDSDAKRQTIFTGRLLWDFSNIWQIDEGVSYPTLRVFDKTSSLPEIGSSAVNKYSVFVENGGLVVQKLHPAEIVSVYSLDGRLIVTEKAKSSEIKLPLPASAVYIVKIMNGETYKIKN